MRLKGYGLCSNPVITDIGHTCYYILFLPIKRLLNRKADNKGNL